MRWPDGRAQHASLCPGEVRDPCRLDDQPGSQAAPVMPPRVRGDAMIPTAAQPHPHPTEPYHQDSRRGPQAL